MTVVTAVFETETPVAFRAGRDKDSAGTLDYLPGPTLRGALAAAHSVIREGKTDEFTSLFLSGAVNYGNGYPSDFEPVGEVDGPVVRPSPGTALTCKRCRGFRSKRTRVGEEIHGVRDGLIHLALFEISGESKGQAIEPLHQCGHAGCKEPLEQLKGFYRRSAADRYEVPELRRELRTRSGISRLRGTVHESILYSRDMLSRGTHFQVRIAGEAEAIEVLRKFIEEAGGLSGIRVGNNRTRGLGALALSGGGWKPLPDADPGLRQRIDAFDKAFRARAHGLIDLKQPVYLPVTCVSDVILEDQLFRNRVRLDGEWVASAAGIAGAKLIAQCASLRRVAGWNAFVGLPKTDEWAIAMGSVFLLSLPNVPDESALERFRLLEERGTGERRVEGFGGIRFADPFHWEVTGI